MMSYGDERASRQLETQGSGGTFDSSLLSLNNDRDCRSSLG
eukprot:CAMPEP_0185586916 /NCGR_PEP_ID=MMETSP0434-20130131/46685_1 /TAXON_ID=626734 ORGANISM="Favella taraikaensis, Strain Fe Narragansett Bay" /NCGR_SAMPLE_ID=MMETSP0434 /ASSEMBLY_ACC=CAM_ASM_000379 /LENGTH=40 /DNA_ID= /DNA_START= /DNA_END= /DNA_ORIENTATION=